MESKKTHGQPRTEAADLSGESGWVTTDVAARAVRVSPRTIRRFIERGLLEAKQEGEGVERRWLVSVDSLHALRATRPVSAQSDREENADNIPDNVADVIRDMAARLEERTAEAVEYRTRLELTELAQSSVEAERERLREDLARERERADRAERRLEELEALPEPRESPEAAPEPSEVTKPRSATEGQQEQASRPQEEQRSWWRRLFGA
jgi:hypothetical protein